MDPELLFFCNCNKDKTPEEIAKIHCTIEHSVKHYAKGEAIAFQGDKVSYLYLLTKGKVKTAIVADSGVMLAVEELKAPYPLAAAFLFADNNRFPVDVIALEDCEVLLVSKACIEQQMAKCPAFLRGFISFNANRLQFMSERLKIFSQKGLKAKIAYYILQKENNGTFDLERSVASLAEYFAVERPSLSRALSELTQNGVIEYRTGKGKILDHNALKAML